MRWASRVLPAAGLALTLATCRDGTAPRTTFAPLAVAPIFPSDATLASFGLAIDGVRFIVVRPATPPDTLADTTVALPPDAESIDLDLRVPLISSAETLYVSIVAMSGAIPLFTGTAPVEVLSGVTPSTPTDIPVLTYVGPGAGVDSIAVSPAVPFLYFNDSLRFQVAAFQAGVPVSQFYISWTTSDTSVARVNSNGVLRAPAARISVRVIARTPGGTAADSTTATFVPFPTQLVVIAGGGQTAAVGQPLATQLEVEVRAADNLPVPSVDVRFRSLSGGTPADTIVTSDAQGRARVTGVLGATPGPQVFQASIPAFPGITAASFGATATDIVISPVTSIVTVGSPSVISGNTVKLRLQGKDASGSDITTGGAAVVFTRSGGTSTGSISATADSGNGVYTAVFTGVLAGTATTIGATINGAPVTTTLPTIAVSPGAISPAGSVVTLSNDTVASGAAVTLRLQGKDAAGNSVTTGGDSVAFGFSGGSSTGTIGATADSGNGVYTAPFTGVLAGTGTSIGASLNGNAVTSPKPLLVVIPGAPAQLVFIATPSVALAGVVMTSVQVEARDLAGNPTPAYAGDVTIAIGTNPGSGVLAGTLTQTASAGVATFSDLAIDLPGIGYTLAATASGVSSATGAAFDVVPPAGTIFWANASGGNWSNPANWTGGVVPSAIETAAITIPGTYTVTLDVGDTVAGLQLGASSGTQTLLAASKTLHVSGTTQVNPNGLLWLKASTLSGGTLSDGGKVFVEGGTTITTGIATSSGSLIRLQGNGTYSAATLTVASGFTSNGTILLTDTTSSYGATLNVTSGTLTNAPTGTIDAAVGSGGPRTLGAQLDNQGALIVSRPLSLSRSSAAHSNSGAITLAGGNLSINQSGTLPSFTNTGSITINAGDSVKISSGAFNYNGGSISGGTLSLTSVTVTAPQSFSTETAGLSLASTTWGGSGTLTIAPATTVVWRASTISAALVNQGTLVVNGTSAFNGPFTNAGGATLQLEGNGSYSTANLTVANSFTNDGAIELTDITSSYGATLNVTSGTLLNASGGTIAALLGTNGPRNLNAQLDNRGTITVATSPSQALNIAKPSAAHQNRGTITLTGGDLSVSQSGTSPSFRSTGTIDVAAGDTLRVSGGAFVYDSGSIGGAGALSLSGVTSGAFNLAHSIASMLIAGSTASFATPQRTGVTGFVISSATINGPGLLTNDLGRFLNVRSSTINADLDNHGTLLVNGSSPFNGALTTGDTSVIRVQGNGTYSTGTMTVLNGFTNNGTIELTDTTSSYGANLNVTNGILVNAPAGTITALPGFNGPRAIGAALNNQGTVTVALGPGKLLTLSKPSAAHLNSGTIDLTGGDLTVTQSGAGASFTTSGTVNIGSGDTLAVSGGSFTYDGSTLGGGGGGALVLSSVNPAAFNVAHTVPAMLVTSSTVVFATPQSTGATGFAFTSSIINGPGSLTNDAGRSLNLRSTTVNTRLNNLGTLLANGTTNVTDTLTTAPGSLLRIQGNGTFSTSTFTVAKGFENSGTVELTDTTSSYGATLAVTNGKLVNLPGALVNVVSGANGPRTLAAELDNQGAIAVALAPNVTLNVNRPLSAHMNSGTIDVSGGDLTVSGASSFTNVGAMTIGGSDTLTISGGSFTYGGGSLDGPGTLVLTSVSPATFAKPHTLGSIILSSSTASFASDQSTGTTDFLLTSSALNGPGTLTNVAGKTLNIRSSGIAAPFINQGTLLANGTSSIDGPLTTVAGSTVRVQGNGTYSTGTLTVTNGLINNGAIELTDTTSSYGATLVVKTLPLVNAGTIDIQPGFGGPRTIDAVLLDNQGTFTAGQSVTISHPDAQHTNRGTFKVKAGAITFAQSGTNESFTNQAGGIIDIDAGTVFRVTNGPVTNALGGKILGFGTLDVRAPATFSHDGEIIPGASPGRLTIDGNMQITSTGIVTIELGGPTPGTEYDQLAITGSAIVAEGTLNVSTIGAFDPRGLSFDVVTFASGSGSFSNFTVPPGCNQPVNTGASIRIVCP